MDKKTKLNPTFQALRKKAEEIVTGKQIELPDFSELDLMSLLHEIEVQHIELELQNQELRQALHDLEASRNKFSELYQTAPVALVTVDDKGLIEQINEAAARLLPGGGDFLVGRSFAALILPEDQPAYFSFLKSYTLRKAASFCELRLKTDGQPAVHVLLQAKAIYDAKGRHHQWRFGMIDISNLKQAQAELLRNEERFKALVTASSEVLYRMSPDWSEMRQLDSRGFLSSTKNNRDWIQEYIHPDDQRRVISVIEEAIRTKSTFIFEHRVIRVDGTLGWTFSRAVPLKDADGEIIEWFGAASDITERKNAEEALHRSEQNLKSELEVAQKLQELSTQTIRSGDFNQLYQQIVNTAAALMKSDFASIQMFYPERGVAGELRLMSHYGFTPQAAEFWQWVDPSSGSACGIALRTRRRVAAVDVQTFDFMEGNGDREIYLRLGVRSVQTTPLFSRSGALMGMLSTHWRVPHELTDGECRSLDILARQAADLIDRRKADDALLHSQSRLKAAMHIAQLGVWEYDTATSLTHFDERCRQIYAIAEDRGISIKEIFGWIHPEDRTRVKNAVSAVLAQGQNGVYETEYRVRRPDGYTVWVAVRGHAVHSGDSNPDSSFKFIGTAMDVTERKQAEEQLRQWSETLEQQVAERTELAEKRARQLQSLSVELIEAEERERKRISVLLHEDLQQILAGARIQLQAMQQSLPSEAKLENVDRLLEVCIEKSRNLSQQISPAILNHADLPTALQWLTRHMSKQFGLSIDLDIRNPQVIEHMPANIFIFRAVQELLFNVVKHAGVKSARVELSISGQFITVAVSDEGQGFDPAMLYHSKAGLGLLSLRERSAYIEGSLEIDSSPGNGTRINLTIPLSLSNIGGPMQQE
jgi:PAS domain S-box-containing protein